MRNPRRWLTIGALLLAATAPAWAGWSSLGGPVEPVVELQLDPGQPELLYARVTASASEISPAVLWRSKDGGVTWRNVQKGLERLSVALAIDPSDPKVIWVWTPEGELWRSGDAGDTWTRRHAPLPDEFIDAVQILVAPHHPSTLFRLTRKSGGFGVDVSRDGGASFQDGVPLPFPSGSFVQARRDELVAFDWMGGLEASTDGGQTWSVRGRYRGNGFVGGRVAPSAPGTLYGQPFFPDSCLARSDDAGAHWRRLAYPRLSVPNFGCQVVAVDPKDDRHVWVGAQPVRFVPATVFELSESRDGGETWSGPLPLPGDDPMSGVVAAGGDLIYTGRYVSTDGGRTWTRNDQGIAAGDARFGLVAQNLPGRGSGLRLVALNNSPDSGPDGLFRSHGGRRWRRLPLAAPRSVIDAGAPIVVAVGEAVVRSEDGGDTWRVVSSAPPYASGLRSNLTRPEYLVLHAFEANDELGDVALWTSDDAGATWRRSSEGLPTACVHVTAVDVCPGFSAYAVDPFDSKRRWIATQGSIFYHPPLFISTDAGASWHVQTEALPDVLALAADPQVKDRLLAGTSSGLFVSEDGGEHWRTLGNGLPDSAAILHFAHDARVATWYAATAERGIYRSLDSGANWTLLPDAPNLEYPAITVDPRTPGALLAAFRAQGVWLWTP